MGNDLVVKVHYGLGSRVVSSIMRKNDYGSGRNLLQWADSRPLVAFQLAGRKGARVAVAARLALDAL